MSDSSQTPIPFIEQLRAWFHPKDRSVQLAPDCWAFMHSTTTLPVDRLTRMPLSLVGIEEKVLTASAPSVTFAVPQVFRSLRLHCLVRVDANSTDGIGIRFNGDGGANYNRQRQRANNITTSAHAAAGAAYMLCGAVDGSDASANSYSVVIIDVMQYRSNLFKAVLASSASFGNGAVANFFHDTSGGQWMSTAAISSLTLLPATGPNFVAGCVFALYGVL